MARIASVSTSLTLESQSFLSGLRQAVDASASSSAKIAGHMGTIVNAGKALIGGALTYGLLDLAKRSLEYASSLGEVAQQLGVTTKDLQVYRYAATQTGISQEEMDKGLAKLTVTIGKAANGSKAQATSFRELGISVRTASGDVRTAGEVIPNLADALAKVKDPATRARIEVELFGKTGQKLDTLLAGGSAQINELRDAIVGLGGVLTEEQIRKADDAADTFSKVKVVLEANIAGAVADNVDSIVGLGNAFAQLAGDIGGALKAYNNWISRYRVESPLASKDAAAQGKRDLLSSEAGRQTLYESVYRRRRAGALSDDEARSDYKAIIAARTREAQAAEQRRQERARTRGTGALPTVDDNGAGANKAAAAAKSAAAKAAREAEQARKKGLAQEDRYQSELARSEDEFLGLRESLSTDARTRAMYEHDQVALDLSQRDKARQMDVAEGQLTAAAAAELKVRDERNAELKDGIINRRLDADLTQQALELMESDVSNRRDLLQGQLDLAKTASERRVLELQLLDLQKREEKARLQSVLTMEDGSDNLNTSKEQKDIASDRLKLLDKLYGNAAESTKRGTMGPGETYLAGLQKSVGEQAEELEGLAVNGLKSFEDQLTDTMTASLKFKGVFGSMANSIISDLMRIAVQKSITGPLANLLFGGSSGGSGGVLGSLGGLLGLGGGLSRNSAAAAAGASYNFAPVPGLANGGTIQGFAGMDKNLLSINGSPVARVARGEMLRVEPNNDNGRGSRSHIVVEPSPYFDVKVRTEAAGVAAPMSVASSAHSRAASAADVARAGRRRIPGR